MSRALFPLTRLSEVRQSGHEEAVVLQLEVLAPDHGQAPRTSAGRLVPVLRESEQGTADGVPSTASVNEKAARARESACCHVVRADA